MTGTQIKALAESHIDDDTIDDGDALLWLNECQAEDLGSEARVLDSEDIVVTDTAAWYALPADLLVITEVEKGGEEYTGSYRLRGQKIRFSETGTFTVWYYRLPAEIVALTEAPEAHILLHRPMALFLASRFKSKDDDENQDAARLMGEYRQKKEHALWQIDNQQQDGSDTVKVVW